MNPFCLACWKHSMIHHYTHCTTSGPKNWNGAKSRQGRTFSFFLLLFWSHLMLVRYRLIALRCWSSTNLGLENDEPLIFVRLQKKAHCWKTPQKVSFCNIAIILYFFTFGVRIQWGPYLVTFEQYARSTILLMSWCICYQDVFGLRGTLQGCLGKNPGNKRCLINVCLHPSK